MIRDCRHLKGFVFDFDGTLARLTIDFPAMRKAALCHLRDFGIDEDGIGNLYVLELIAEGTRRIAERFPGRELIYARQAKDLIKEIEIDAARQGALIPGIRKMINDLQKRKIRTGIVTRNCRAAVDIVFPDLASFAEVVLTRDDTPRVKPDPAHLREVLQAMALPAAAAAMVGDHAMDMRLAKEVGAYAIGVLTGYAGNAELRAAGADMILDTAAEIPLLFADPDI